MAQAKKPDEIAAFDARIFDKALQHATENAAYQKRDYLVRYNERPGDKRPHSFMAEDAVHAAAEFSWLYEHAALLLRVDAYGMITVLRDTGNHMAEWHAFRYSVSGKMPEQIGPKKSLAEYEAEAAAEGKVPVPSPNVELPWQKRQREAAEKLDAVVALRNQVRSTLGM